MKNLINWTSKMIQSPRRKETWNEEQTVFHKNRMSCRYSLRSFLIEKPPPCAVRLKIKENRWHSTAPHPSATHKKRVCVCVWETGDRLLWTCLAGSLAMNYSAAPTWWCGDKTPGVRKPERTSSAKCSGPSSSSSLPFTTALHSEVISFSPPLSIP